MLRLREIMSRELVTVGPELSIRDAMELLATRHVSGAPVVAEGKVVGVISSTDLLGFAASLPGVPAERGAPSGEGEDDWGEPPEWETEPPAAYFTELWADAGADALERMQETAGPEWNALEEHTVSEAMTSSVCSLPGETLVPRAAAYMTRAGIHRILVIDDGALVGIVTATDIAKAVAGQRLLTHTYVFGRERDFDEQGWRSVPSGERDEQAAGTEDAGER